MPVVVPAMCVTIVLMSMPAAVCVPVMLALCLLRLDVLVLRMCVCMPVIVPAVRVVVPTMRVIVALVATMQVVKRPHTH